MAARANAVTSEQVNAFNVRAGAVGGWTDRAVAELLLIPPSPLAASALWRRTASASIVRGRS